MKKLLVLFCAGMFEFCSHFACAATQPDDNLLYEHVQLIGYKFPMEISVEKLVEKMRRDLPFAVHFESEKLSAKKSGISAKEFYAKLAKKSSADLDETDRLRLQEFKKLIDEGNGDTIVDFNRRYITLAADDLLNFKKLREKLVSTGVYDAEIAHSSIIIFPRNSAYERVDFKADFSCTQEAIKTIIPLLKERELNLMVFVKRPVKLEKNGTPDMSFLPISNMSPQKICFNSKNEELRMFLSRLCAASNPQMQWTIGGYESGRHISFSFKSKSAD